ncbi:MAG TPA: glycosyltransferase [Acidimicrobiia bacterium]|nr:glycosyltransferase [Acidimicrobiia bacterium]
MTDEQRRGEVELSVLVPAHDAAATLAAQLDALVGQDWTGSWEIVVADHRSTDGTAALAREYAARHPRVRVETVTAGRGAAAARNAAARCARGVNLAMVDADDIVGPRWVAAMGDALRDHECVTGPLEVRRLNPAWLVATRGVPSSTAPMTFHGLFPTIAAGNLGIRASVWRAVGGFDEAVVAQEDAELSLRLRAAGVAVHFAPDALVHYRYRHEPRVLFRQGLLYGTYRPLVARRARAAGLGRAPRFAGWRSWVVLVVWLPRLATRTGRAAWSWVAGVRLGTLRGSVRYRTWYL